MHYYQEESPGVAAQITRKANGGRETLSLVDSPQARASSRRLRWPISDFGQLSIAGRLARPRDPDWDIARAAWNLAAEQQPSAVAFVESAEDVAGVVRFASAQGLIGMILFAVAISASESLPKAAGVLLAAWLPISAIGSIMGNVLDSIGALMLIGSTIWIARSASPSAQA